MPNACKGVNMTTTQTTTTQQAKAFDIKTKAINYNVLVEEIFNSTPQELNSMFFMQYPYSLTNKALATVQCHAQGFKFGLLQCCSKWTEQNRTQKKNAQRLWLRMPSTYIKKDKHGQIILNENGEPEKAFYYKFANNWLVYDQTEGQELDMQELNHVFNLEKTLNNLLIKKVDYDHEGGAGGYAIVNKRQLAVNPAWHDVSTVAKVVFHEIAHIVHEHTPEQSREQKELEAELTAMLVAKVFNMDTQNQSAYIKQWISKNVKLLNQDTYKKCLQACELIIKASMADKPVLQYKDNKYISVK